MADNDHPSKPLSDEQRKTLAAFYNEYYSASVIFDRCHLVTEEHLAVDFVQEAFYKFAKNIGNYEPSAKFTTYLFRIIENIHIDHLRKKKLESSIYD